AVPHGRNHILYDHADVLSRASQTIEWEEGRHLDIGLDHVSLARAHPTGSPESADHFDKAVDRIRRAGYLDHLPPALLARGTPVPLEEPPRIPSRGGMGLSLAAPRPAKSKKEPPPA